MENTMPILEKIFKKTFHIYIEKYTSTFPVIENLSAGDKKLTFLTSVVYIRSDSSPCAKTIVSPLKV